MHPSINWTDMYKGRLNYSFKALESAPFSSEDKDLIKDYVNRLKAEGLSESRLSDQIYNLIVLRRGFSCNFKDASRKDLENLMIWLNGQGYTPYSRMMRTNTLKRFYKWIRTDSIDKNIPYPPEISWIHIGVKRNEMVKPEILYEEEIKKLIETANTLRNKAFVAVIFEGGFRISELLTMRLSDVEPTDFGFRVMVSGKTGFRTVPLISSAPLLSLYIENHPRKEDLQGPLWVHFGQRNRYGSLSYFAAYNMIRELAKRAGVKKRIYPHLFRHSAATRDAKYLTEAEMKIKYGWDQSSKMAAVYVHMSGRDLDQKIASIYSDKPVEMPKPEFRPILCPRCNEKNTPGQRYCGRCGGPLNPEEVAKTGLEVEIMKQEYKEIKDLLSKLLAEKSL